MGHRSGLGLLGMLVVVVALSCACSGGLSKADQAKKEAQAACGVETPGVNNPPATTLDEAQQGQAQNRSAMSHAAKAAGLDSKWDTLSHAYSAIDDAWAYNIAVVMPAPTNSSGQHVVGATEVATAKSLQTAAKTAEATIRAECEVANAD